MNFEESGIIWGGYKWSKMTSERLANNLCLEQYGYKVYSQNDEDGIIEEIFHRIGVTNKKFVEFGVENGLECNSHYLIYKNWSGLWIEGSEENYNDILLKFKPVIAGKFLDVQNAFITRDNINKIINDSGIKGEIDLLSIDVDGNDYYIWESINVVNPRVVIIEYNAKFSPDVEWIMAYNTNHLWDGSDWHGASLKSLEILGNRLGYQLVGTNINGANAFFVRNDLTKKLFYLPAVAEELYNPLRLELSHKNGNPARFCLFNQKDNLGIFNYQDEKIEMLYGFHMEEKWENNLIVQWISSKNSCIRYYNKDKRSVNEVIIPYNVPEIEEKIELTVFISEEIVEKKFIKNVSGEICIKIPPQYSNNEILIFNLILSKLWQPSKVFASLDERKLGIAILKNKVKINYLN